MPFKVSNNILAIRLLVLSKKIKLDDLNLSLNSFKTKYKVVFLSWWANNQITSCAFSKMYFFCCESTERQQPYIQLQMIFYSKVFFIYVKYIVGSQGVVVLVLWDTRKCGYPMGFTGVRVLLDEECKGWEWSSSWYNSCKIKQLLWDSITFIFYHISSREEIAAQLCLHDKFERFTFSRDK